MKALEILNEVNEQINMSSGYVFVNENILSTKTKQGWKIHFRKKDK